MIAIATKTNTHHGMVSAESSPKKPDAAAPNSPYRPICMAL